MFFKANKWVRGGCGPCALQLHQRAQQTNQKRNYRAEEETRTKERLALVKERKTRQQVKSKLSTHRERGVHQERKSIRVLLLMGAYMKSSRCKSALPQADGARSARE